MKAVAIKCPNCGAGVYVEPGKTRCFCSNCGEPIYIQDDVKRSVHTEIKYDPVEDKRLELEYRKYEKECRRLDGLIRILTILTIMAVVIVAIAGVLKNTSYLLMSMDVLMILLLALITVHRKRSNLTK